jgi:hypothetical protein
MLYGKGSTYHAGRDIIERFFKVGLNFFSVGQSHSS